MHRFLVPASFVFVLATAGVMAQQPSVPQLPDTPARPANAQVLHAGTQLVVVDVVVQDHDGQPVHGLKREDFSLLEKDQPQTITGFEEHTAQTPAIKRPEMPKLPPGTFTNYTPVPPTGTLNVLLLDTLNTPMKDQSYVRYQLQQYVKKADPGTRIAIFGLTSRLIILQGFTQDPEILKDAVDHKLIPRASVLLDDPAGTGSDSDLMSSDFASGQVSDNLAQFEAMTNSFQTQMRTQYTLDAFNMLARYLSGFPGRKNLIWFSGSFPINIMPDATLADPFSVVASSEDEFRQTTNLLTRAQVAVYPIDARGLMTTPVFSAANSGHGMNGPAFAAKIQSFGQSQAEEHQTMEAMASATGGHAYYNTNGLAEAVSKAISAGSNYYTISYTPTNKKWQGEYRSIKVTLNASAPHGLKLAYREGYYADDPDHPRTKEDTAAAAITNAVEDHSDAAYAQAALGRGAPTPEDILFKVRVLPASTTTEDKVADGNQVDPAKPLKPPFRRFLVDYAVLVSSFTLLPQPDGNHKGTVEFSVLAYDSDGKLLNATGKTIALNLTPENFKQFQRAAASGAGAAAHLEISTPAKQEVYLRIAIHDVTSNKFGVVEIPTSKVANLPPPPPPAQPAPAQSAPSQTPPPSTH